MGPSIRFVFVGANIESMSDSNEGYPSNGKNQFFIILINEGKEQKYKNYLGFTTIWQIIGETKIKLITKQK